MCDPNIPQCQYFVVRKKRLCRMSVKPGKHFCGEHEPQPKSSSGEIDTRVPCPYDSKHTCYSSKLESHLKICNARPQDQPDYIKKFVNSPTNAEDCRRLPLAQIPSQRIIKVIEKVNALFDLYIKDKITSSPERPIHPSVLQEFNEAGRTESSLRHLRQVSSLLHLVEEEQLVRPNTCYVELGAGKGHLSYFAWRAWCRGTGSGVLLVDRASHRHKRDNKLRGAPGDASRVQRLRADLAHLALGRVPAARACDGVVGLAKHLCGEATDFALRCLAEGAEGAGRVRGAALATCCQHRCARASYAAAAHLRELGVDGDDFDAMLGIVSWATCGDGRGRGAPRRPARDEAEPPQSGPEPLRLSRELREEVGRRAKAVLDWGRVLYLRERGFEARLVRFVPAAVSLENVCIVAKRAASRFE